MDKVGIFYGPVGGSTEKVALQIAGLIGNDNCDLISTTDATVADVENYKNIIFGIATIGNETWNSDPVKSGWFNFMNELQKSDLSSKVIALFGLGDHIRYADHFVDAMGELYILLSEKGVDTVGHVPASEYTFRDSKSLKDDKFVGLPVDEDFEPALTEKRIQEWVGNIVKLFS